MNSNLSGPTKAVCYREVSVIGQYLHAFCNLCM